MSARSRLPADEARYLASLTGHIALGPASRCSSDLAPLIPQAVRHLGCHETAGREQTDLGFPSEQAEPVADERGYFDGCGGVEYDGDRRVLAASVEP